MSSGRFSSTGGFRFWKLVAICGALATLVFAVATTVYAPHDGYALLLYNVVPKAVWVIFLGALVSGTYLMYLGARGNDRAWRAGVVIVVASYLVFWFFPTFAGLRFWSAPRGDVLGHFGKVKAILATGENPANNMYPGLHWLLAILVEVSGVRLGLTQPTVSATYYGTFVTGMFLFARQTFGSTTARYVGVALVPLVFSKYVHSIMPWFASFSLLPLVLLVAEADRVRRFGAKLPTAVIGLTLTFGIVFIHPMTALVAGALLAIGWVGASLSTLRGETYARRPPLMWAIIIGLPFSAWYLEAHGFTTKLVSAILSILHTSAGAASKASEAGGSTYTLRQLVARYFVLDFGAALLYISLAGFVALYLCRRFWRREADEHEVTLVGYYGAGLLLAVTMLAFNLVVASVYRMNQVTLLASILLVGYGIRKLTTATSHPYAQAAVRSVVLLSVVSTVVLAPFMIYDEERHVVETEMAGAEHHLVHRAPTLTTKSMSMSHQLSMFVLGEHRVPNWRQWAFVRHRPENQLPSHLGYGTNQTVGALFEERGYVVTKARDRIWYRNQPPNRWSSIRYLRESDVQRLQSDPTAERVYSNGEFSTWYVRNTTATGSA